MPTSARSSDWRPGRRSSTEQMWRDAAAALDARKAGQAHPRSLPAGGLRAPAADVWRNDVVARDVPYRCLLESDGYKTKCGAAVDRRRLASTATSPGWCSPRSALTRPEAKATAAKEAGHGQQRAEVLRLQAESRRSRCDVRARGVVAVGVQGGEAATRRAARRSEEPARPHGHWRRVPGSDRRSGCDVGGAVGRPRRGVARSASSARSSSRSRCASRRATRGRSRLKRVAVRWVK